MNAKKKTSHAGSGTALKEALDACRASFMSAAFFSLFVNLLMLLPAIYMLQIYDRVMTSGSESTLLMLTLIVVFLFVVLGGLEWLRAQILIVSSMRLDALLGPKVHDAIFTRTLSSGGRQADAQPLTDLDRVRQFLTGQGLFAILDVPWLPIYVAVMFMVHWWFGIGAILSALVLISLAVWNEVATRDLLQDANKHEAKANLKTAAHLRNIEVIESMGMLPRLRERWSAVHDAALRSQHQASRRAGLISALSKTFRLVVQSLMLGLGAYLALRRDISAGSIIAGSILLGRALAPIDALIGNWRGVVSARAAYGRLSELLAATPDRPAPMQLPEPRGEYRLDKLVIQPPGARTPLIDGLSLVIDAGTQVAVLGASGAGKSTLLRALLGLHKPKTGELRLDGAELDQYEREAMGRNIGYLPQDVELLEGTVAENIARFGEVDSDAVVAAAELAGVHAMILGFAEGYETRLDSGFVLSAGQRQRVALARAVYKVPKIVILDEPNSNLDEAGNAALHRALLELRHMHSTVVIVTHRTQVLSQVDRILLLVEGKLALYGARDQITSKLQQAAARVAHPVSNNRASEALVSVGGTAHE
ncbi:type I secretion system permease/ATPase [Variovorax humicola]|uniref:Type I secretion system permease/ATPase n=1 Tax=Variovorax humicola TaxID=1769758 RepID=A0ABU8WAX7_9BURK